MICSKRIFAIDDRWDLVGYNYKYNLSQIIIQVSYSTFIFEIPSPSRVTSWAFVNLWSRIFTMSRALEISNLLLVPHLPS